MLLNLRDTLQKLKGYNNSPFPILSAYLSVSQSTDLAKHFEDMVTSSYPDHKKALVEDDIVYISSFLSTLKNKHKYKAIALFSGGNKLWEVVTTLFDLPESVTIAFSPHTAPLVKALAVYNRYLVILADRKKTRLYTLYLGTIEEKEEFSENDVPQKVRAQGSSELAKKIDRHIKDHLHKHFNLVATHVADFVKRRPLAGVVVGGHKESLHVLEKHLPKNLREKIIGEFIADTDLDTNSVITKSKAIIAKAPL